MKPHVSHLILNSNDFTWPFMESYKLKAKKYGKVNRWRKNKFKDFMNFYTVAYLLSIFFFIPHNSESNGPT